MRGGTPVTVAGIALAGLAGCALGLGLLTGGAVRADDRLVAGAVFRDCPACPEMVVVPAGDFTMGSPAGEPGRGDDEGPQRRVRVESFAAGRFEVTREEFAAFANDTGRLAPSDCIVLIDGVIKPQGSWRDPGFRQTDRDPVACVSWHDARDYAGWLSDRTGQPYRLLSEAEWEYAARAGTVTARFWGDAPRQACGYANGYDRTAKSRYGLPWAAHDCRDGHEATAPVGSFAANRFGLHDMLGNVLEWVTDCWHEDYRGAPGDGGVWGGGDCSRRVLRGGSWDEGPWNLRAADRSRYVTGYRDYYFGFRVARTL